MTKQEMRKKAAAAGPYTAAESAGIAEHLLALPELRRSESVLAFYPLKAEPQIVPVLQQLLAWGIRLYLPYTDASLRIHPRRVYSLDELVPGRYGVMEPPEQAEETGRIAAVILPGVAFDRNFYRLGHGAGCYDRFLADRQCLKIGVVSERLLFEEVPCEPHDCRADLLVTDRTVYRQE